MSRLATYGIAAALALAAWLRLHGLAVQVVQDDEFHAIHKLLTAGYGEIARSFGFADHSIPLTLFYKAMAETVGLTEVNMRGVQVLCGIALVGVCAWLALRATANAALAVLFAFLVAGAPFLVLYSRFARPYAITTLLSVLTLAAIWRWRTSRSLPLAAGICAMSSLAAWLHPLSALYPMAALLFVLVEDLQQRGWKPRAAVPVLLLGLAAGVAIIGPLVPPLLGDLQSLAAKAGDSRPTPYTLSRAASLFAGGLPDAVTAVVAIVAAWGAGVRLRAGGVVDRYLLFTMAAPLLAVILLRGSWTHQGHTLARYVFPAQLAFLFWFAAGAMDLARRMRPRNAPSAQAAAAGALAAAYLGLNPAITQVRTLGPWYGHLYYHFDYTPADNRALRHYDNWKVPAFYHKLGALPPGSVTFLHVPFDFAAPYNPDPFYIPFHRQRAVPGLVHGLCFQGSRYYGEVPPDERFRFRSFVHVHDREAVLRSGARYIVLKRDLRNGEPYPEAERCMEELARRYGPPIDVEPRLAVFEVRRG